MSISRDEFDGLIASVRKLAELVHEHRHTVDVGSHQGDTWPPSSASQAYEIMLELDALASPETSHADQ